MSLAAYVKGREHVPGGWQPELLLTPPSLSIFELTSLNGNGRQIYGTITSLTLADAPPVPAPGTAALLAAALIIGGAGRHRARAV